MKIRTATADRQEIEFNTQTGAEVGVAIARGDKWTHFDHANMPALVAVSYDTAIEAAIESIIARMSLYARPSSRMIEAKRQALKCDVIGSIPVPQVVCCHYCGQPVEADTINNPLGAIQCMDCR